MRRISARTKGTRSLTLACSWTPFSLHGYLETVTLKDSELSHEERQKYLAVALRNSERMRKLVAELRSAGSPGRARAAKTTRARVGSRARRAWQARKASEASGVRRS